MTVLEMARGPQNRRLPPVEASKMPIDVMLPHEADGAGKVMVEALEVCPPVPLDAPVVLP